MWNLVTTMSSLCTALDLLQNGGITSGNDVFFVVFWTLHGNAKYLVMMFMDKKVKRCFRNSLAACVAFASEFGRLWCNFIFPGCACRLSTTTNQFIFLPNCVLHFSGSCMMFLRSLWTKRTFLEFVMSLNLFGNGDEFNQHEFINVKLNVFGAFGICVIPLPYSRRDKCKKTNIAQCMLHEQRTCFALVVSCVEKN